MDNWDDEDFEPAPPKTNVASDQWEGEDEDEGLKDNWDDEEEEEKPKPEETPKPAEPKKGGKKHLQQKLKQKEEEERKKAEERRQQDENKTPEQKMADHLLAQKLSEESELEIVKGQFNAEEMDPNKLTIDSFNPRTKEDFIKFSQLIQDKLKTVEESPHYFYLVETVLESAIIKLDPENLKKLSTHANAVASEKLKMEKQKKGGKKSTKAKLGGGLKATKNDEMDDYSKYDDFDDFM